MLEILDEAKLQKFQEILEKIYKETNVEDIETLVEYFANSLREVIPWLNLESKFEAEIYWWVEGVGGWGFIV